MYLNIVEECEAVGEFGIEMVIKTYKTKQMKENMVIISTKKIKSFYGNTNLEYLSNQHFHEMFLKRWINKKNVLYHK